jgi:sodium-dependent dicarboxylate transporter 2/3/5
MVITKKNLGIILGPLCFIFILQFLHPEGLNDNAKAVLAITSWVAIWWISESVSMAITSLLPIVLFPLCGVLSLEDTTASYGHKYIYLFLGGFILAIAIEKWHLHKRIALNIIKIIGTDINQIILGFMIATAFMSMWISNTATTVMILPVAIAIVSQLNDNPNTVVNENIKFGKVMMLAVAYSASIGGMATLIGTPTNLIFAGVIEKTFQTEVTFMQWFIFALPFSVVLLFICWLYLTKVAFKFEQTKFPGGKQEVNKQLKELGKLTKNEKRVLMVFCLTVFAWITRSFLLVDLLPKLDDTIIAIASAVALFVIPSDHKGKNLMEWEDAVKLPWGILLLFGCGMALAMAFDNSGLATWIGEKLHLLDGVSTFLILLVIVAAVNFLTEITSNVATTAMLLPVLIPLAVTVNVDPYLLLVGATIAASCAFMLPVATPPNAIVFAAGYLKINDMVKNGFWLNIISIILLTLFVYFILPFAWNLN